MRKLEFTDLLIDGFKCFKPKTRLPLHEHGPGVHFIRGRNEAEPRLGPNGSGKSSLFDALCWCLYGKTPDGGRNPDIRPWHGPKRTTTVSVVLKVDRRSYCVTRDASPNALLIDGYAAGQENVDKLVGLSFEAFTHTVLLGQGEPLFFDLQPRDKMQLFSDVLDLDRWEQRSAAASKRYQELTDQRNVSSGELSSLVSLGDELADRLKKLERAADDWDLENEQRQAGTDEELKTVKAALVQARNKCAKLVSKWNALEADAATCGDDLNELQPHRGALLALDLKVRDLEEEYNSDESTCPTCGQALDRRKLALRRQAIRRELEEVDQLRKQQLKAERQAEKVKERLAGIRERMRAVEVDLREHDAAVAGLEAEQRGLERIARERRETVNPHRGQVKDLKGKVAEVKVGIETLEGEVAALERKAIRAQFWVRGFKDVRLYVIEEVLQDLELATNAALEDVGLVGWSVEYDVEKETKSGTTQRGLHVMIRSPVTSERVRWESWSGGEQQRLRVVGALALSEVLLSHAGVRPSMEILDEPAHFMAAGGIRDLVDYLAARAQSLGRATFYVDHASMDSGRFESVTTVVKDKEGSYLE